MLLPTCCYCRCPPAAHLLLLLLPLLLLQGLIVDSKKDNSTLFVDIFGEELAGVLLALIAQDSP